MSTVSTPATGTYTRKAAVCHTHYYGTSYYTIKEYAPHTLRNGTLAWRLVAQQYGSYTGNEIKRLGYPIGGLHNKQLTEIEAAEFRHAIAHAFARILAA